MRHRVYGKKLGRDKNQRSALFKSLIGALITYGSVETTESKAKAVKGLVDKIINQAKHKETQALVSSLLINKKIQEKLIDEIAPTMKDRTSGYTSVVRLGSRLGDGAMMVRMSLLGNISKGLPEKKATVVKKQETSEEKEKVEAKAINKVTTGRSIRKTKVEVKGTSRSSK